MDLLDLQGEQLYFDEPVPEQVTELLLRAAAAYGEGQSENLLLRAFFYAPDNLSVLVALYRSYFYQHRLEDALQVAQRAVQVTAQRLELPGDWRKVDMAYFSEALFKSMGLLRFYLIALKAEAYLYLRLGQIEEGRERLQKVSELDSRDHFGAGALLDMLDKSRGLSVVKTEERVEAQEVKHV